MLQYVRKYMVMYYMLTFVPPAVFVAIVVITSGPAAVITPLNWMITIGMMVICSLISSRIMNRSADHFIEKMVHAYNEECDPSVILDQGKDIRSKIKTPFNEWGSWFLSGYCLASIDVGNVDEARQLVEMLRKSAKDAKTPEIAARICLNMHAPIKKLYGSELASHCLDEAEMLLAQEVNTAAVRDCMSFIDWERKVEKAESAEDEEALITLYSDLKSQSRQYMRTRVLAAFHEAAAYRKLGDSTHEAECLSFAAEHGNLLIEAIWARKRLREIAS